MQRSWLPAAALLLLLASGLHAEAVTYAVPFPTRELAAEWPGVPTWALALGSWIHRYGILVWMAGLLGIPLALASRELRCPPPGSDQAPAEPVLLDHGLRRGVVFPGGLYLILALGWSLHLGSWVPALGALALVGAFVGVHAATAATGRSPCCQDPVFGIRATRIEDGVRVHHIVCHRTFPKVLRVPDHSPGDGLRRRPAWARALAVAAAAAMLAMAAFTLWWGSGGQRAFMLAMMGPGLAAFGYGWVFPYLRPHIGEVERRRRRPGEPGWLDVPGAFD